MASVGSLWRTLMNVMPSVCLAMTVIAIACGQVLFKLAAPAFPERLFSPAILGLLTNGYLILALLLYLVATFLWVFVLRTMPLSIAYPVSALAYVAVPLLAWLVLGEKVGWNGFLGAALIVGGVAVSSL